MAASDPIDMTADFLDSRDINARLDYLDELETTMNSEEGTPEERNAAAEELDDAQEERDALTALVEEADNGVIAEWQFGETLISDDYFEVYAEEMAYDIGAIDREASWPLQHIDWAAAAESLQQDYTQLTLNGRTYWAR